VSQFGLDLHVETHQSRRRSSLEDALRRAIRSGRLAAGQRVPSSRAMAEDLGWARGTVAAAYEQLVAEGYLESRTGVGTVVASVGRHTPAEPVEPRYGGLNLDLLPGAPEPGGFPVAAWLRASRDALTAAHPRSFDYGNGQGEPTLRQALATYLGRARGVSADPDHVVVTAGVTQALWLISRVVAARGGRTLAMEDPCHEPHRDAVRDAGLEVVPLPVDRYGARVDTLDALRPDAVFTTPAHQYPMGVTLSPERRQELVAWARTSGGLVVEDDYDGELRYDRRPVGALQGTAPDHVAYVGTASKILGPGVRLGWAVLPDGWVDDVRRAQDVATQGLDVTSQLTFATFLESYAYDRLVRSRRATYRRRVAELGDALAGGRFSISGIAAGGHLLVNLPADVEGVEKAVVREGIRRGLLLVGLDVLRHGPAPYPPAIVLGYTRPSAFAWPPLMKRFLGILRDVVH
jgi:GntR family transcriptional regulator/MocR family aminotransferase